MRPGLLTCLFFCALSAAAAPFAVQLGDTRIGLDAPPGFADTSFTGSPRLQELGEALTSASNRILLFAISDADLRRFSQGDTPDLRRYMIAVTPKGLERERVTTAMFGTFVSDSLHELDAVAQAEADYRTYLDSKPHGQLSMLAELRRDPEIVSVLEGTRLPSPPRGIFSAEKPAQYGLTSTTLLLLRGKAINLQVYTVYDTPADLDWIRANTVRWIDELRRLNTR